MKVFFCGFLNSGAKKIKKQHQLVELGFDRSLVVGAFNALIDYCYFNQTLTRGRPGRKIPQSEKKDYWKRERECVCFLHFSTWQRESINRYPGQLSRLAQCLDRFNLLASKTYFFLFFYFLTLRQGL